MPNFESFLARHGEFVVQAIIEGFERREGICLEGWVPLEERWNAFVEKTGWADARGARA